MLGSEGRRSPVPTFEAMASFFFNDMPSDAALEAYEKLTPSPTAPLIEPIDMTKFFELELPQTVLVTTDDMTMPEGYYYHPYYSSRLRAFDLWEMPGGHEPMFSDPRGLAEKLGEIYASHDSALSGH